ncbi:MAG TPA: hypothetical protein VJ921_13575 [Vicinamibacteria bacterium]|nr:hypothetical protein [Vicinamibacteria bacterium]
MRLLVAFLALSAVCSHGPSTDVTLPAGTEIKIRLEQDLGGETFSATLAAPLSAHGTLLARAGAPVWGEWTAGDEGSARLTMTLRGVEVNGRSHMLEAAPLVVDAEGVGPGSLFRLPLAKPLDLPPQPGE